MSPKTLTGAELQVDDAPARDSELFLVDGNNLAYRAFFALPEELATSDGFPTNALLGFTNMLFKLLTDYKPKAVAVAWDTRPTERAAIATAQIYKEGRREMADLLREQFPYFRPMMTPRGVQEPHVYTPERVEARYGIRPDQVPDFIGLKGDTSDNIPGVPGIGDKTAGQLISQYGSVEEVIAHADELSPARKKNILQHADTALESKQLATMRRDLDTDCEPSELVLAPPDRSQLREMFRRFEFRGLLNRIDLLDEAVPAAAPPKIVGTQVDWREGAVEPAE